MSYLMFAVLGLWAAGAMAGNLPGVDHGPHFAPGTAQEPYQSIDRSIAEVRALLGVRSREDAGHPALGAGEVLDAVCGMVVNTSDTPYVLRIGGVAYSFCSRSCQHGFASDQSPIHGA